MMEKLQQGDRFPALTLSLVGGGQVRIPDDSPGRYAASVVLPRPLVTLLYAAVGRPGKKRRPSWKLWKQPSTPSVLTTWNKPPR